MKESIIKKCISFIRNNNNYTDDKIEEIKYGLEAIYLTLTKTIFIVGISLYLKIFFEMITLLFFYNILRFFSFGIHASKSWICLTVSTIIFIFTPYMCKLIEISFLIKVIISFVCVLIFIMYAPSDTHKRPLIKTKQRQILKIITFLISLLFTFLLLIIKNDFLSNAIMFSMIIQAIMILPITYKIFKMPYRNYLHYKYTN